jgi:beta-glucosidase
LKNDHNTLPLKKGASIALVGPLADARENMPGTWSVAADFSKPMTVIEGLKAAMGQGAKLMYAKGSNLDSDSAFEERAGMFGKSFKRDKRTASEMIDEAVAIANQADVGGGCPRRVGGNDGRK